MQQYQYANTMADAHLSHTQPAGDPLGVAPSPAMAFTSTTALPTATTDPTAHQDDEDDEDDDGSCHDSDMIQMGSDVTGDVSGAGILALRTATGRAGAARASWIAVAADSFNAALKAGFVANADAGHPHP